MDKELFDLAVARGLYTKDYNTFRETYSTPANRTFLFSKLKEKGVYQKTEDDFLEEYYGVKKKPTKDLSTPSTSATAPSDMPSAPNYTWGSSGAEKITTPTYADQLREAPGYASPEATKEIVATNKLMAEDTARRTAIEKVRAKRNGDYTKTGDEFMDDYTREQISGKSALEENLGLTDPNQASTREYKFRTDAIKADILDLENGIEALDDQILKGLGDDAFQEQEALVTQINGLAAKLQPFEQNPPKTEKEINEFNDWAFQYNELVKRAQEFEEHPLVKERNQMASAYDANITRVKQMLSDDRYKNVNEILGFAKKRQEAFDRPTSPGEVLMAAAGSFIPGGAAVGLTAIPEANSMLSNALGRGLSGIGRLGDVVETLTTGDKTYTKIDALQDWMIGLEEDIAMSTPAPTRFSRPLTTKTAKWKEFQVDIKEGKIEAIRDKQGKVVDKKISSADEEEILALPAKSQFNGYALPYKVGTTLADAGVMIFGAGKIAAPLKGVLGANMASKIGVTASTVGQMINPLYEEGMKMFNNKEKASAYALTTSTLIGISSNLFGWEAKMIGGGGFLDDILKSTPKGIVTPVQRVMGIAKEGFGDVAEEAIIEPLIDSAVRVQMGQPGKKWDKEEFVETAIISFATRVIMGGATGNVKKAALHTATQNVDGFEKELRSQAEQGLIEIDEIGIQRERAKVEKVKGLMNALEAPPEIIDLVEEKVELEEKKGRLEAANLPTEVVENQITAKNQEIMESLDRPIGSPAQDLITAFTEEVDGEKVTDFEAVREALQDPDTYNLSEEDVLEVREMMGETPTTQEAQSENTESPTTPSVESAAVETQASEAPVETISEAGITPISEEIAPEVASDPFKPFKDIVNESATPQEAFEKIQEIKGVDPEVAKEFRETYDPDNNLSQIEAFEKFYDEVKGEVPVNEVAELPDAQEAPVEATESNAPINPRDLSFEEQGGAVVESLSKGDKITVAGKEYVVKTKTTKQTVLSGPDGAVTIKHGENENYGTAPRGKQNKAEQLFRAIEGDLAVDFINENNPFHEPSDSYRRLTEAVNARNESLVEDTDTQIKTAKKRLKDSLNTSLGVAYDPAKHAEQVAETFNALVDLAKLYIKQGVNNVVDFAKKVGKSVLEVIDAWVAAQVKNSPDLTQVKVQKLIPIGPKTQRFVEKFFKETFTAYGQLPKEVFNRNAKRIAGIDKRVSEASYIARRLQKFVTPENRADVMAALQGQAELLPAVENYDQLIEGVKEFRNLIDTASKEMIALGIVDGKLATTLDENMNLYVNRAYRIHTDKKWIDDVQKLPAFNKAVNWFIGTQTEFLSTLAGKRRIYDGYLANAQAKFNEFSGMTENQKKSEYWGKKIEQLEQSTQDEMDKVRQWSHNIPEDSTQEEIDRIETKAYAQEKAIMAKRNETLKKYTQYLLNSQDPAYFQNEAAKAEKATAFWENKIKALEEFTRLEEMKLAEPQAHVVGLLREQQVDVKQSSRMGSMNLGILGKRKELAPELRELFGEYDDPIITAMTTVFKQANLIENFKFLADVEAMGKGKFLFEVKTGDHTVQIAKSGTYAPLNEYFTTPEIAEAFSGKKEGIDPVIRWVAKFVSVPKYMNTIGSVMSHANNFFSGMWFHLQNGHFNAAKEFPNAFKTVWADAYGDSKKYQEKMLEYIEAGIIDDGIAMGEMKDALDVYKSLYSEPEGMEMVTQHKGLGKVKKAAEWAYKSEDRVHKIVGYELEKARYEKAGLTPSEAKEMASKRVRNGYPTYSLISKNVQRLRAIPFIATFPSFPYEVLRTTKNQMVAAYEDFQDPRTRGIGLQRAIGVSTAIALPYALSMMTMAALGLDDEDEDRIRLVAPEWDKNATYLFLNSTPEGATYIPFQRFIPIQQVAAPINALLNEKSETRFNDAVYQLIAPFMGTDMTTRVTMEAMFNEKLDSAKKVAAKDDPENVETRIKHAMKVFYPGTFNSIVKITESYSDNNPRKREPANEWMSLFSGIRMQKLDYDQNFSFVARDLGIRKKDNKAIYYTGQRQGSDETERATLAWEKMSRSAINYVEAYRGLGLEEKKIKQSLQRGGFNKEEIKAFLAGEVPELKFKD